MISLIRINMVMIVHDNGIALSAFIAKVKRLLAEKMMDRLKGVGQGIENFWPPQRKEYTDGYTQFNSPDRPEALNWI